MVFLSDDRSGEGGVQTRRWEKRGREVAGARPLRVSPLRDVVSGFKGVGPVGQVGLGLSLLQSRIVRECALAIRVTGASPELPPALYSGACRAQLHRFAACPTLLRVFA